MSRLSTFLIFSLLLTGIAYAQTEDVEFFEAKIRPLLAEHCYSCHSAKAEKLQAGLYLDRRDAIVKGGESGPAVVPGKPAESLLIKAVRYQEYEMPPDGKLPDAEIGLLTKWVELGAPWPNAEPSAAVSRETGYDWDYFRNEHWSFVPVKKPGQPIVQQMTWPRNEIDAFVLARLESKQLVPNPPAPAQLLARRIYLDLLGIPPTPAQVADFVAAAEMDRQGATTQLVNELLESPHYGQRWGRHWLDVARFSDGYGGFLDNDVNTQAWRYRDWVVAAFNDDMPYNEFIKLQIAGDLIGPREQAVATGFFSLGPTYRSDGGDPDSVAQAMSETLDDRMDTMSRGFLGLTAACARCHDHKFDPIPQQDYYSLAGIFNNTQSRDTPLVPDDVVKAYDDHQQSINELTKGIGDLQNAVKQQNREATDDEAKRLAEMRTKLDELKKTAPPKYEFVHALADTGSQDMPIALRGNLRKPGDVAPRRFLRILAGDAPQHFSQGSGRVELAEAIASDDNPLTARVLVNRVWQHHFGNALVRSPSNFGTLGEKPTHPLLLDWLAATFVESDWSIKQLHRRIMTSATYQMSSDYSEVSFAADGDNRMIWRMNPRRMDVETWRDSLLFITGELDQTPGGPSIENIQASSRRTLYAKVSRNGDQFASDEFLRLFDFPLMRATVANRPNSIVPQQFLFAMNSTFMVDRAKVLAKSLQSESESDESRIRSAYLRLYGREPTGDERQLALDYLRQPDTGTSNDDLSRWTQYAQVLLSSNEFMYVR
ncbi:MAG: PSD1 and planctomycete cytochrome C domain-containing protein [Planctomycetota bacterium]|nr:PSD1 and planctomycete cytochrome C domain-containing protein [Planctomycetota bacterium]